MTTAAVYRLETGLVAHVESFKRYPAEARARGDCRSPGAIRIATAGPTHRVDELLQSMKLRLLAREDLPAADLPNDVGVIWFLSLITAHGRRITPARSFLYAIVGNAHDRPQMRRGSC
jgi:hypothetical protein